MVPDPLLDRLRTADPAAELTVSDDERGRSRALADAAIAAERDAPPQAARPAAWSQRRWPALAAVGVAVLAAVPLTGALRGAGTDRAQAGPVAAIAARAADVPPFPAPTRDRPYAYVRRAISGPTVVHLRSGRQAPARYRQDVESWQRADGRGRLRTVRRPLTFVDPDDATAAGTRAERTLVDDDRLGPGEATAQASNGIGRPLILGEAEIAALPDEPRALAATLAGAVARASAGVREPAAVRLGPARTVTDLAADLLSLDAVRPAVRAELVRVIGRADDVRVRPGMRDPEGRSGTGLEWRSAEGHGTVLLIDPVTARVLGQRTAIPDPAGASPADGSAPTIDVWTTILAAGAVASDASRPAVVRP